ncbi:unnamed protein product [Lepeophtheirus salmonis]|uniref:(salmon louse) hypothetical protein n=1 Tax=Lepeophtheirus salmonis TaxID=72036 RepID=A0A7R8D4Z7_LEPSM|nr:unnamed protein product [Lepeophtheirus salmonis]CAF3001081.1 unnamed protein product [Lepeophtheirus salmonis]
MRSDLRNNQSELVREEGSSHRGANFTHFIQKLGGWFIIFWRNLIRMITTRPMMMMISPSTVVNHHRTALSALDQLEEYGIKEDKTRLQSVMESSSVREENFKTTGLIGTSFPPLIPHTHHQRCSSQQNSASLLTCSSFNAKHHSESDLTGIGILNERSPGEDFIISSTKPSEQIPSKEVTVPEIKTSMEASEETVFTMDEDEPTSENTFTLYSENDKCVITDNDVCKFLLGLEEEKTFDKISWDNKPQESDDSTSSSSTSSPINMSVTSSKFEGTLPTIKASPGSSSFSVNPNIEIKNNEEEFTPLQKKNHR